MKLSLLLCLSLIFFGCKTTEPVASENVLGTEQNPPAESTSDEPQAIDYGSPNVKLYAKNSRMFLIEQYATDKTYGYTVENPIMVGGVEEMQGPRNEKRFLNASAGSGGEPLTYKRLGSCCGFKSERGFNGFGLLDQYEVSYDGLDEPITLYINMYDSDTLKVPVGFRLAQ